MQMPTVHGSLRNDVEARTFHQRISLNLGWLALQKWHFSSKRGIWRTDFFPMAFTQNHMFFPIPRGLLLTVPVCRGERVGWRSFMSKAGEMKICLECGLALLKAED